MACQNVEAAEPSTIAPSCRDLSYEKFARNSGKRVGPHRYPASIVMSADGLTEGPISRRGTSKRPTFVSPMAFHSVTAISMPGHACDRGHQGGVDAALIIGAVQGASLFLGSNASLAMAVEPGGHLLRIEPLRRQLFSGTYICHWPFVDRSRMASCQERGSSAGPSDRP